MTGPLARAWFQRRHHELKAAKAAELDTNALLEILDREVHPKQSLFVHDKSRRVAALVGARGGKSTGGRVRFLRKMLTVKRCRCLFVAPKLHQAKKIIWEPFKDMLRALGIEYHATESNSELKIRLLHNGSTLQLGGAATKADLSTYRGLAFHEIGIDECTSFKPGYLEHLVNRVLAPRLGDFRGSLWLISTPGHYLSGLFYEITRPGSEEGTPIDEQDGPPDGYSTHHWSLKDGAPYAKALANAWAEALETKRRNSWTDDHPVWKREYLGLWAADDSENIYKYRPHDDDGNELNQWNPEKDGKGFAILPEHLRRQTILYSFGVDPGIRDPFGLVIWAWCPHDPEKTLYQVYEFAQKGMYAEKVSTLFLGDTPEGTDPKTRLTRPKGIIGHVGWPAKKVADKQNNLALFDELANVYGLFFEKAEKRDKQAHQELFNGDLLQGRMKILKGSKLEEQLLTLQYVVDEVGGIEEDTSARNDLADAALYGRMAASHLHSSEPPPKEPYFPARDSSPDDDTGPDTESFEEVLLFDEEPDFF